jgi:hypothetical protein
MSDEARFLFGQNVPAKLNFLNCCDAAALPTWEVSARVLRRTSGWTFIRRQLKWPAVGVRASKPKE